MKLTWEDFEVHRGAATPGQWRRMEAYFKEGKTIALFRCTQLILYP